MIPAIAAENQSLVVPNMEFEYLEPAMREDLYQIIKYSCQGICLSTNEPDKVAKIWTTFLEPMLGVSPLSPQTEETDGVWNTKSC